MTVELSANVATGDLLLVNKDPPNLFTVHVPSNHTPQPLFCLLQDVTSDQAFDLAEMGIVISKHT